MTFIDRISTAAVFNNTLSNVSQVQRNLFELQDQISSGVRTRTFEGIAPDTERFTALEDRIARTEQFSENNTIGLSRLRTSDIALEEAISVVDDLQDLIVLARSPNRDSIEFESQVGALREQLAATLNQSFRGTFLFGGTRSDAPPVATNPIPLGAPGALDNSYYQGSSENASLRADERIEIEFDVRADNTAFQQAFAALTLAEGATDDATLATAQDLVNTALDGITDLRTSVNADIIYVESINSRLSNVRLYFEGVASEIISTDIVAASTQLAQDQTILQASFQAFATVNQLSLSDFL